MLPSYIVVQHGYFSTNEPSYQVYEYQYNGSYGAVNNCQNHPTSLHLALDRMRYLRAPSRWSKELPFYCEVCNSMAIIMIMNGENMKFFCDKHYPK